MQQLEGILAMLLAHQVSKVAVILVLGQAMVLVIIHTNIHIPFTLSKLGIRILVVLGKAMILVVLCPVTILVQNSGITRYHQCCIKKMAKGWQTHMGVEAIPH